MSRKLESRFWLNKVKPRLEGFIGMYFRKTQELARKGVPDVEILMHKCFIVLELKKDLDTEKSAYKDEPLQAEIVERIKRAGGYGRFVSPETWPEVEAVLLELATTKKMLPHMESILNYRPKGTKYG